MMRTGVYLRLLFSSLTVSHSHFLPLLSSVKLSPATFARSARTPALVGVWISFLATLVLLVNFACQYSHTKREKELIARAHGKQFESTPNSKYGSPTPYAHSQGSAL